MDDTFKSRCVCGEPIEYWWIGEFVESKEDEEFLRSLSHSFAARVANQALMDGSLLSKDFDKFIMRTTAHTEQMLNRLKRGAMRPGSEVVPLAKTQNEEVGCQMTEIRWEHTERMIHEKNNKLKVRHYVAEPTQKEKYVFGLVLHRKITENLSDDEISELQNEKIDEAIELRDKAIFHEWNLEELIQDGK